MNKKLVYIALCTVPCSAFAYIDPGSGALIWQGLLALLGAVLVFVRAPFQFIKYWFKRIFRK